MIEEKIIIKRNLTSWTNLLSDQSLSVIIRAGK